MVHSFNTQLSSIRGLCGAMVAHLTPDQKVACSNHVRVTNIFSFFSFYTGLVHKGCTDVTMSVNTLPRTMSCPAYFWGILAQCAFTTDFSSMSEWGRAIRCGCMPHPRHIFPVYFIPWLCWPYPLAKNNVFPNIRLRHIGEVGLKYVVACYTQDVFPWPVHLIPWLGEETEKYYSTSVAIVTRNINFSGWVDYYGSFVVSTAHVMYNGCIDKTK